MESSVKFDQTEESGIEKILEDKDPIPVDDLELMSSKADIVQTENVETVDHTKPNTKLSVSMQESSGSIFVPPVLERDSLGSALSEGE